MGDPLPYSLAEQGSGGLYGSGFLGAVGTAVNQTESLLSWD